MVDSVSRVEPGLGRNRMRLKIQSKPQPVSVLTGAVKLKMGIVVADLQVEKTSIVCSHRTAETKLSTDPFVL